MNYEALLLRILAHLSASFSTKHVHGFNSNSITRYFEIIQDIICNQFDKEKKLRWCDHTLKYCELFLSSFLYNFLTTGREKKFKFAGAPFTPTGSQSIQRQQFLRQPPPGLIVTLLFNYFSRYALRLSMVEDQSIPLLLSSFKNNNSFGLSEDSSVHISDPHALFSTLSL